MGALLDVLTATPSNTNNNNNTLTTTTTHQQQQQHHTNNNTPTTTHQRQQQHHTKEYLRLHSIFTRKNQSSTLSNLLWYKKLRYISDRMFTLDHLSYCYYSLLLLSLSLLLSLLLILPLLLHIRNKPLFI